MVQVDNLGLGGGTPHCTSLEAVIVILYSKKLFLGTLSLPASFPPVTSLSSTPQTATSSIFSSANFTSSLSKLNLPWVLSSKCTLWLGWAALIQFSYLKITTSTLQTCGFKIDPLSTVRGFVMFRNVSESNTPVFFFADASFQH